MSKCDEKNREPTGNTPSSRHDQLQPHPVEEERKDRGASQGDSISIISKKVADRWLSKIIRNEYSITVHPKSCGSIPERLIRNLRDDELECTLKDDKLTVTGKDPLKMATLITILKNKGYFVEGC